MASRPSRSAKDVDGSPLPESTRKEKAEENFAWVGEFEVQGKKRYYKELEWGGIRFKAS